MKYDIQNPIFTFTFSTWILLVENALSRKKLMNKNWTDHSKQGCKKPTNANEKSKTQTSPHFGYPFLEKNIPFWVINSTWALLFKESLSSVFKQNDNSSSRFCTAKTIQASCWIYSVRIFTSIEFKKTFFMFFTVVQILSYVSSQFAFSKTNLTLNGEWLKLFIKNKYFEFTSFFNIKLQR